MLTLLGGIWLYLIEFLLSASVAPWQSVSIAWMMKSYNIWGCIHDVPRFTVILQWTCDCFCFMDIFFVGSRVSQASKLWKYWLRALLEVSDCPSVLGWYITDGCSQMLRYVLSLFVTCKMKKLTQFQTIDFGVPQILHTFLNIKLAR